MEYESKLTIKHLTWKLIGISFSPRATTALSLLARNNYFIIYWPHIAWKLIRIIYSSRKGVKRYLADNTWFTDQSTNLHVPKGCKTICPLFSKGGTKIPCKQNSCILSFMNISSFNFQVISWTDLYEYEKGVQYVLYWNGDKIYYSTTCITNYMARICRGLFWHS